MLREAVELIRELWKGEVVDDHGEHLTVVNARIYTLAETQVPPAEGRVTYSSGVVPGEEH